MNDLWTLLSQYTSREGITNAQLSRQTGVDHTQLIRLRDGKTTKVSPDTLRRLATGTGLPLVELIIASGMWTAEELGVDVVRVDPHSLPNEDLLEVLARRLPQELNRDGDGQVVAGGGSWVASAAYSLEGGSSAVETSREAPLARADAEQPTRETNGAH